MKLVYYEALSDYGWIFATNKVKYGKKNVKYFYNHSRKPNSYFMYSDLRYSIKTEYCEDCFFISYD